MDNVTEVVLASSERPTGPVTAGEDEGGDECRTRYQITKFEILVVLGEANVGQPVAPAAPATPVASAQAAVATSQQASASAGGGE